MATPAHTKHIRIASRPASKRRDLADADAERFRLRLALDQRLADMKLNRYLSEVWDL